MFRKRKVLVLASLVCLLVLALALPAQASPAWLKNGEGDSSHREDWQNFQRVAGQDRFGTSIKIAEQTYPNTVQNIVLASGDGYADALSASVLAHKLNAPIILVNDGVRDSQEAINYIQQHLAQGGQVYIVGGRGVISTRLADALRQMGYTVTRIGGADRYQTDTQVAEQLNVPVNTPIILASGKDFPDALGISSVAASNGWPILLSGPENLPQSVQDFVYNDQPSQAYIVGGTGVISTNVQDQLQSIVPNAAITRLAGADRFATLAAILDKFFPDPTQIYVASGDGFADALSGSPLAANHNAPILLVDPNSNTLPPAVVTYLLQLQAKGVQPQIETLGGTATVPDAILQNIANILNGQLGQPQATTVAPTPSTPTLTAPSGSTSDGNGD